MSPLTYIVALSVVSVMAIITGERSMLRTMAALFGAWLACWGYVESSIWLADNGYIAKASYTPWLWFMFVDTVAARIILLKPAGKIQALIGVCFLVQIAMHTAYALIYAQYGYDSAVAISHWEYTNIIGYAKLALVALWGLGHGGFLRRLGFYRVGGISGPPHSGRA